MLELFFLLDSFQTYLLFFTNENPFTSHTYETTVWRSVWTRKRSNPLRVKEKKDVHFRLIDWVEGGIQNHQVGKALLSGGQISCLKTSVSSALNNN
jgi:hypothetical protein